MNISLSHRPMHEDSPHGSIAYVPRISLGVGLFGGALVAFMLAAIVTILWGGLAFLPTVTCVAVLGAIALYAVDSLFFTRYVLGEGGLIIQGQLRQLSIAYPDIRAVRYGSALALITRGRHKRHALATNCVVLELGEGHYRSVSLSPAKEKEFLGALMSNMEKSGAFARKGTSGRHA